MTHRVDTFNGGRVALAFHDFASLTHLFPRRTMATERDNHEFRDEPTEELPDALPDAGELTIRRSISPLAPELPVEPCRLEQVRGPGSPNVFVVQSEDVVIGRSSAADIQLDCPDLSRLHLRLRSRAGAHRVVDLDSKNGVFLNGVRVHSATLIDGDSLQLGDVLLVFRAGRR